MFNKIDKEEVVAFLAIAGAVYITTELASVSLKLIKRRRARKAA